MTTQPTTARRQSWRLASIVLVVTALVSLASWAAAHDHIMLPGTPSATRTPLPPSPSPGATETATPHATRTPQPTATPEPTATPPHAPAGAPVRTVVATPVPLTTWTVTRAPSGVTTGNIVPPPTSTSIPTPVGTGTATPPPDRPGLPAPGVPVTPSAPLTSTVEPGGTMALTFDCGYGAASLNRILATLAAYDVRATFFMEGKWVERTPEVISATLAGGHELGNHSYSHPDFTTLTQEQVEAELATMAARVAWAGGPATLSLFRYPFGAHNAQTDAWVTAQGYRVVGWDIDPMGWKSSTTAAQVYRTVRTEARPGAIVIMHCASDADEGALEPAIRHLQGAGYTLVPVSELASPLPAAR